MLTRRGLNRRAITLGCCVLYQWIERLWVEINQVVLYYFSNFFTFIDLDPKICKGINYGLSAQGNLTLLQMWSKGVVILDTIAPGSASDRGPLPEFEFINNVEVPENNLLVKDSTNGGKSSENQSINR